MSGHSTTASSDRDSLFGSGIPDSGSKSTRFERWLLKRLLRFVGNPPVRISLWDGADIRGNLSERNFGLRIQDRATLWKLLSAPDFYLMESYVQGDIVIEGDLANFMGVLNRTWRTRWTLWDSLRRWLPSRSLRVSRDNVASHYDLGNDFYELWLDEQLVYTCAYFESPQMSLEAAQTAKMDHVCRKLRLKPGEHVIEAGCGWGALALHMAREYGVQVRAYNVSSEQMRYARERARTEGLSGQVEFVEQDWRTITGQCDAFVSVGMLEHVGPENYHRLGDVIQRCLAPDGRGLIHSIGLNYRQPLNRWISRRIFPGAQPPSLQQMMDIFEPNDMSVIDVENLRPHYAETLRNWLSRFEQSVELLRTKYDDTFIRAWRMYLAGSQSAFEAGSLQLFQVLFTPTLSLDVPWTRRDLYQDARFLQPTG